MGKRILVVEDEYLIVETVTEVLLWDGHEVSSAASGVAALEQIATRMPEIVLTDLMMPLMDGAALIRHLRSRPETAEMPIVLMTAAAMNISTEAYDVLLLKPFKVAGLRDAIRRALELRGR